MMKEISFQSKEQRTPRKVSQWGRQNTDKQFDSIEEMLTTFIDKAKRLLILERYELQKGNFITYGKCGNPEINRIRAELFSDSKSHGGLFKELIDRVDTYLYYLLTAG
jgi:hypothetical protein